ncbi:MAG: acyl-CoA dehydrogenase family protein [Pseudomonadota bacterium]
MKRLSDFMAAHIDPGQSTYNEQRASSDRWATPPIVEQLKIEAQREGLWNLFLPPSQEHDSGEFSGAGLTNLQYAPLAEIMARVEWASEVFNCSAPDSGNMEILHRFGTDYQKDRWLRPLMRGEIRSAFFMTEPDVASSDATNIETQISRDGNDFIISGRKWWASGVGDPRCKFAIVMGKTNPEGPRHLQQTQIIVPLDAPGVSIERMLPVYGFDDAPHGHAEVALEGVRVPATNVILGEGRGFEVAQGRLGPGRIHHCMRTIGVAEVALELMAKRLMSRNVFGKPIAKHSVWEHRIGHARTNIEMCRLLTLKAAYMMDTVGNKVAKDEIAMIKVAAPKIALQVIDDAIQAFGGAGVSHDTPLAKMYAGIRSLRIADGPDEVHLRAIARSELKKHQSTVA